MITLSNRQRKSADRPSGIELMIPLPKSLRVPRGMQEDEEEDGGDAEYRVARSLLEPGLAEDGLAIKKVKIAMVRAHSAKIEQRVVAPHLVVHIVGFRWFHAVDPPPPIVTWHAVSMKPGTAGEVDRQTEPVAPMKPPEAEAIAPEILPVPVAPSSHDWTADPRSFSECLIAWEQAHGWSIAAAAREMKLDNATTYRQWRDDRRAPRMEPTLRLLMTLIDRDTKTK